MTRVSQATMPSARNEAAFVLPLYLPFLLVLFMHPGLAFLNANGLPASNALVGASEGVIYILTFFIIGERFRLRAAFIIIVLATFTLIRCTVIEGLDVKTFRDFLIAILFYEFGRMRLNPELMSRILKISILIVWTFGLFEWIFPDTYTTTLQILNYYSARGEVPIETLDAASSGLSLNGMRPEGIGRTFFPALLGDQRMSSVFIEPVSLGNFAAICIAWFVLLPKIDKLFLGLAAGLIAFSDARFGGAICLVPIMLRLTGLSIPRVILLLLPMCSLLFLGVLAGEKAQGDDLSGRLIMSANYLATVDLAGFLGFNPKASYIFDSGYSYFLLNGGLLLTGFMWVQFTLFSCLGIRQRLFFSFVAIYFVLMMFVSNSATSMKTAAFLWAALGALASSRRSEQAAPSSFSAAPQAPPADYGLPVHMKAL